MNINKLKGKIVENGMNVDGVAERMGMSYQMLNRRLGKPEKITVGEAIQMKTILNLTNDEAVEIFLT